MSRLFKKNNSVSRVVALWLVFVMMATPFFAHAGIEKDSKANNQTVTASYSMESFGIDETNIEGKIKTDNNSYYISADSSNEEVIYSHGIDEISFTAPSDIEVTTDSKTWTSVLVNDGNGNFVTGYQIGLKKVGVNDNLDTRVDDGSSLSGISDIKVTNGEKVGVYVSLIIEDGSQQPISTPYTLQRTYVFTDADPFAGTDASNPFTAALNDDDKWCNTLQMDITNAPNMQYYMGDSYKRFGKVKYGFILDANTVNLDDITEWKELTSQSLEISADTQGEYQVYLGYFVGDKLVNAVKVGDTDDSVKIDNVAPVIDADKTGLYYSTNWGTFDINNEEPITGTATFRNDTDKAHYRYYVVVDNGSGKKVDSNEIKLLVNGTEQYFGFTSSGVDGVFYGQATNYTGTVTVSINDGLNTASTSGSLANLVQLDSSHEVYTYEWDEATAINPGTTLPDSTTETLIGEQYKLTINAETYDKIARVNIVDESGNICWYIENGDQQVNPSTYYEFSCTFNIPADADVNFSDKLFINVIKADGNNTIMESVALGTIMYDNTNPIILTENAIDNTSVLPTDLPGVNQWYGSGETEGLKFKVVSGDQKAAYESDISSVEYKIGTNTEKTISPDANGVYTVPLSELESQNSGGTKVLITATDEAGNEYKNMYTYYYDATKPVFDNTNYIYAMQNGSVCSGAIYVNATTANTTAIYTEFSDAVGVKNIKYKLSKCDGTVYVEPTEWSLALPLYTDEHYFGIDQLIPTLDGTTDGKYKLEIQLVDLAGNESATKSIEFTVDCTNPVIQSIELQAKGSTDLNWVPVSEDECFTITAGTNAGKSAMFTTKDTEYRYVITYSDANISGALLVDDITLNGDLVDYTGDRIDVTNGEVILNIKEDIISAVEPVMIIALLRDVAGNYVTMETSPLIQRLDNNVRISAWLLDSEGNPIEELTPKGYDSVISGASEYTVRVDYNSAIKIDTSEAEVPRLVYDKTDGTGINTILATDTVNAKIISNGEEINAQDKKYHYIVDYTLPSEANVKFTSISAYAKNIGDGSSTVYECEIDLKDILFDKTVPIIYKGNGTETFVDNGAGAWVEAVNADYVVKSGDSTVYESQLGSVKVSTAGGDYVEMITAGTPVDSYTGTINLNTSSATAAGTEVKIIATDVAGNSKTYTYVYYIDTTQPTATLTVNDKTSFTDDITGMPTIKATAKDTLTLQSATINVQAPNGTTYTKTYHNTKEAADNITKEATYTLADIIGAENVTDGTYSVYLKSIDNVGHETTSATVSFTLDNTLPTVTAKITSGTVSSKSSYYYNTDVTVTFTKSDKNMEFITVKDGDKTVDVKWSDTPDANGVYTGTATFTAERAHSVTISAQDNAGNQSTPATVSFLIDKTKPVVSTTLGGVIYTDDSGFKYFTSNVSLGASVSDTNEDKKDLNYQIIQAKPDQEVTTSSYIETSARSFDYTEEADYTINLFAVDLADNTSATRTVKFRVDKNAPKLTIGGVGSGAASSATTVSFTMEEAFWKDASGQITIYRKPGEGQGEELLKTIDVTPTAFETVVRETLTETGIYRIEFSATDRAGHSSATNTTFTIDKDAPVVTLTSADNYALTDEAVPTTIEITDDFYITKKITLSGTRTDIDGKVNNIDFGDYNPAGNPTIIYQNFEEDGIYDIEVTVTDVAGNSDTKSVHFTIDKTDPVIGDLPDIDGKILTSFSWEEDLDELVSDLTVCDVHMYLNGSEYDGESAIEDGSYTLLITAEDELGHKVEKQVSFILDTKAPVFIVTGVEDGEVKNEEYTIDVSLQLEEDTLTSVKLNGEDVLVSNNTCTISVTEKGEYVLEMTAIDEAGNESSMKLEFKYGEEAKSWLWIIIVAASVLLLGGIGFIVWKKKKDK
ncbi:MAG: Ig-like domain repeat protein [Lachnospiraceae bacterium]|nr:Ig-like domain repeat protein [Lachnospiraceae bacterium]